MPFAVAGASEAVVIAVVLVVLALIFAVRQWSARRTRDGEELSEADAHYLARQDVRRWLGSALMMIIAAGMIAGTRIDPRVSRTNLRLFAAIWIGICVLVCLLMLLAVIDWFAIRQYALRHRRALADQRREAIEAERRRWATLHAENSSPPGSNGRSSSDG